MTVQNVKMTCSVIPNEAKGSHKQDCFAKARNDNK